MHNRLKIKYIKFKIIILEVKKNKIINNLNTLKKTSILK